MGGRGLGVLIIVWGLLLILVPWVIFPVCGVGRYAPPPGQPIGVHACHGTLKAETALGILTIVLGVVPLLWFRRGVVILVSAAAVVDAVLVILFPTVITGICKVPTMACRMGTLPALVILGIILGLTGMSGLVIGAKMKISPGSELR